MVNILVVGAPLDGLNMLVSNETEAATQTDQEQVAFSSSVLVVTIALYGIQAVTQVAATAYFLIKSKEITEIKFLPKAMMIVATVSTLFYLLKFSNQYFDFMKMNLMVMNYIAPVFRTA